MAKAIVLNSSWIWISMYFIVFVKGQTIVTSSDSTSNQTEKVFNNISEPIGNHTEELSANHTHFIDDVTDGIVNIFNRTGEVVIDIYEPIANRTKEFIDDISDDINNIWEHNDTVRILDKTKNCSIVVGIALAGGLIALLAIGLGIPLVLCLLGFTCWGIMAGSAAACCQSGIGDVPAGSCFACLQSTGAGGGMAYIIFACIVGVPIGIGLGGYIADTYFHCF